MRRYACQMRSELLVAASFNHAMIDDIISD